ncbi:SDR family NAD(P)-dependent oxidoreductase [Cetobacterium sp.]|uniref:SDR family NAD(P)-dependent oxidoreductase n=1 Tax=Cetobacterium sp. TaxID=2071632 RepID=UPI003EE6D9DB
MKNKIALITGATRGIGLAVAETLGREGYKVILNGLLEDEGQKVVTDLKNNGIDAELYICDVTDEKAVDKMVNEIGTNYGHIDTVINNAGGLGGREKFEGMTTEFYRRVMALNLDSTLFVTRAAIPYLKNSKNLPSIINYTSIAAYNGGGPGAGVYSAAKGAVLTMTRSMAKELIAYGIRVNAISPGTIDTAFHSATNKDIMESWKSGIAIGRFGESKEVADIISFLVSEKASYLVGEVIQINGGQAYL